MWEGGALKITQRVLQWDSLSYYLLVLLHFGTLVGVKKKELENFEDVSCELVPDVCIRARQLCGGGGGHRGLLCDGREDALAARGPRNVSALIPHNLERGTRTNRLLINILN